VFDAGERNLGDRPRIVEAESPMLRAPNGVVEDSMNYWSAARRV